MLTRPYARGKTAQWSQRIRRRWRAGNCGACWQPPQPPTDQFEWPGLRLSKPLDVVPGMPLHRTYPHAPGETASQLSKIPPALHLSPRSSKYSPCPSCQRRRAKQRLRRSRIVANSSLHTLVSQRPVGTRRRQALRRCFSIAFHAAHLEHRLLRWQDPRSSAKKPSASEFGGS